MTADELLRELTTRGLADEALVNRIKRDALISGDSAETVMWRQRTVDDVKIAELKSELLKVPYKKVSVADVDSKLFDLVPEETARTYQVMPITLRR